MLQLNRLKPWKLLKTSQGPPVPLFNIALNRYRNPRNELELDAIVLHANPTVNIFTLTENEEVLLVEQFRFGSARFHLELPAGLVDPGEDTLQAAKRELLEETGFQSENWESIGISYINPAYVDNTCQHFLARNAKNVQAISLDHLEDIAIHRVPLSDIPALIKKGIICDSVSRAAYAMFRLHGST